MEGDAAKRLGRLYGNFNKKSKGGCGPEIRMARTLATKESQPLAVIKTAFSGTSVAATERRAADRFVFPYTGRCSRSESAKS